jgi:hypothetical protein
MSKKLLLVLVVIGAMLVSFSLVMGAKGPKIANDTEPYVKPMVSSNIHVAPARNYPTHQKGTAQTQPLGPLAGEVNVGGEPQQIATCNLQPGAAYLITGWILGQELYANYEDPLAYGCTNIYPFQITQMHFWVGVPGALTFIGTFRLYTADLTNPACPVPGVEFWNSGLLGWNLTGPGNWNLGYTVPASDTICYDTTYFVVMDVYDDWSATPLDAISASDGLICQSYNDYGFGWEDLVADWGWPGQIMLYTQGLTAPNACAPPPPPDTSCNLQNDAGTYWYVYGNLLGDGYATYFDPTGVCASPTYPFGIDTITFELDDLDPGNPPYGPPTWPLDVRVTVYDYISDICMGPVVPVHSEVFTIQESEAGLNGIKRGFSQPVCVNGPFFVGLFLENGTDFQPTFSETMDPSDSCHAWAYWGGVWYNWAEVAAAFGGYIGFPFIRAHGFTNYVGCPPVPPTECDTLQYTHGSPLNTLTRPSSTYHRFYTNERFTAPLAGTVGKASVLFSARVGAPDAAILIWDDDGTGLPLNKIDSVYVAPPVPVYPTWCVVDFSSFNITFAEGEEFHVGFTCPNYIESPQSNQLRLYADAGGYLSDRLSEWFDDFGFWGEFINTYSGSPDYDAFINVEFCYDQPNFELSASPGSHEIDWTQTTSYNVDLKSILGFNIPVTLTVAGFPPSAGTATFVPNPVVPSGSSVLNIVPVNSPAAAGEYVLTITGTAGAITHQATVKLKIDSPFNQEALIDFYHGQQRVSNFGAVANDAEAVNFTYSPDNALFDGSFIVATDAEHMAMDVYDCHYLNWLASAPLDIYYDATYNANVAYANFFTTESAISCEYDSVFFVGIMDSCVDFSLKIKVYYNPTATPIYNMYMSMFEDWDVLPDPAFNWGDMDFSHNLIWQYDSSVTNVVYGLFKAPFYDDPLHSLVLMRNEDYVYPNAGFCSGWGRDSLFYWMSLPGPHYAGYTSTNSANDHCILMTAGPIDLLPGDKHIEEWINFRRDLTDGLSWQQWWHRVLRYAGFYRGDVNASDSLEVPSLDVTDLVYLIQYLYQNGPAPKPYADQGDVNGDHKVDVLDVVYMINYVFNGGPSLIDYVRFIPQMWDRPSLFENPTWH